METTAIATSRDTVRLDETGYPARFYFPLEAIHGARLAASEKQTYCPYKGHANYFDVVVDGKRLFDAAWCYSQPLASVANIAGRIAFDHPQLTLHFEEY